MVFMWRREWCRVRTWALGNSLRQMGQRKDRDKDLDLLAASLWCRGMKPLKILGQATNFRTNEFNAPSSMSQEYKEKSRNVNKLK
jgi:hypothetical protein